MSADQMFQFRNGSIKRSLQQNVTKKKMKFQFRNGSIKSYDFTEKTISYSGFNSEMVRLKVAYLIFDYKAQDSFNSEMVRLKDT